MINFLCRLLLAPVLIAVFAVLGLIYIVIMGLAWILFGQAQIILTWPNWR